MDVIGHFGLNHEPFRSIVEPEQAFESGPFIAARQQVMGALLRGGRLIAVVGGPGAGKSLLLRAIEKTAFGGRGVMRVDRVDLADAALASNNRVLLLDDADELDDATFVRLAERTSEPEGPRVILACAQRCMDRLPAEIVPTVVSLSYLDTAESKAYLNDRVERAGRAGLFDPAALDMLADAGRGIPGVLRVLGGNALFHAAFDGSARVEARHAEQAAAMQDLRQPAAPVHPPAPPAREPSPEYAAAAVAAPVAAAAASPVAARTEAAPPPMIDEPVVERRRDWWRSAPPLARLAIVVGLLLLCLPVLGYFVGAIKDNRPSTESSYLPDDEVSVEESGTADAETDAAPPPTAEADVVPAIPVEEPPVEVADVGMPQDLTPDLAREEQPPEEEATAEQREPAAEPPQVAEVDEPPVPAPAASPPDVAPASGGRRVFVHYSRAKSGASEAAADVARALRERGFEVVEIRDVPGAIEQASVRYFYSTDRESAEALHDALGEVLRGRGFSAGDLKSMTDYRPSPRRGTMEVWVPA